MTFWKLIRRSLQFHWRSHFGVVLGTMIGSAVLIGALVVGDSMRESLRERALLRLGNIEFALHSGDRPFRDSLAKELSLAQEEGSTVSPVFASSLQLFGTAAASDGSVRANHVQIIGVDEQFWQLASHPVAFYKMPADATVISRALAQQLGTKPGDSILLRISKANHLTSDAPLSPKQQSSIALKLKIHAIASDSDFGQFNLHTSQQLPLNAFVSLITLQRELEMTNEANLIVVGRTNRQEGFSSRLAGAPDYIHLTWRLPALLKKCFKLADCEHSLRVTPTRGIVELNSQRVFLDRAVDEVAPAIETNPQAVLTYLANLVYVRTNTTPYSMVTAVGAPWTPVDMREDEIILNQWLADDLQTKPGDEISLTYFNPESGTRLVERTNTFRVRGIVPMEMPWADRTLMPDFPGIEKAESTSDWDAGFPLIHKIRPKDEDYWKKYRGTPKAFVTIAAGKKMWANRFGELTAIRFPIPTSERPEAFQNALEKRILASLKPEELGLRFEPVREQALKAAEQSQDFSRLFLSLSFFLIVAALVLMALLFQFGLEQRITEIGTLLTLGFTQKQVRRLLLREGIVLALIGGAVGAIGGIVYAKAMLHGLTTVWRDAVGTSLLQFHASPKTLAIGFLASIVVATLTIWLTLQKQAKRPARELIADEIQVSGFKFQVGRAGVARLLGIIVSLGALSLVSWAIWKNETANAEVFFSAGALVLIAGLGFAETWLKKVATHPSTIKLSLGSFGLRNSTRRRKRTLATISMFACGSFLIVAVSAFRLDSNQNAAKRSSGTGGFALIGETTLPVIHDLNSKSGRDFFALNERDLAGVNFVPFRVHEGDEASCLNLNRAQKPRLLGLNPDEMAKRETFTFTGVAGDFYTNPWLLLRTTKIYPDVIPAIGDANSIQWALHKKIGDTIDFTDERGNVFKLRLVGAVANSILQGSLIIDEAEFVKRFPSESGYKMFLIDAPTNHVAEVLATLSRAMEDVGLELTPAARRLNEFNAVQNTYLGTFQILGGLGLLLGSAGLGIVVLRNVLERRGELGLLVAVGFHKRALQWMLLSEHGASLGIGLGIGLLAAIVAILPSLTSPSAGVPLGSLVLTIGGVFLNGALWTWLATRYALRGNLLAALRNE